VLVRFAYENYLAEHPDANPEPDAEGANP
jgi:hypothetical protein